MPDPGHTNQAGTPKAVAKQSFKLYVSSTSAISQRAIANARHVLQELLPGQHQLVIVNISEHVEMARADQIVASPTLLRVSPLPLRRFIGDLSDGELLRRALRPSESEAP